VYLSIYASLAPPVLAIVGAPNFMIDWSNPTSTGKTTTLKVAASCWGSSDERSPEKVLYSWDATRVWTERAASVLNCLPLILDESKRARNQKAVAQTLYDISNGSGRGRGTPRGLARAGAWTTVLLSTGEAPVTSITEDGGTRARTISLWGPPFGRADEETGAVVASIRAAVDTHHGHAGALLVEHLVAHRGKWGRYRDDYRKLMAAYAKAAGDDPVLARLGEYLAALALTAALAEEAGAIPTFDYPVVKLWDALRACGAEADRAKVALEMVTSWAHSHQHEFFGRHREDSTGEAIPPVRGWAGAWDKGDEWEIVVFLPDRIRGS
jgi:putative DNA primase/helicase